MWGSGIEGMKVNAKGKLSPAREDVEFGIFGVDKVKLKHGLLSIIRLKNRKKINEFPNVIISAELKMAIMECLNGVNPDLTTLSRPDQQYLQKFIKRSHVSNLSIPKVNHNSSVRSHTETEHFFSHLQRTLEIGLGEVKSGNNSKELVNDIYHTLKLLLHYNKISLPYFIDTVRAVQSELKNID